MRLRLSILLLLALIPVLGHALGLGKLDLISALNEPFEARLELLSATVEELDSLNVRLADEAAFQRAGIPRPQVLSELDFVIKETESGPDYIRVYSNDPIREPFLNFLLEISWAKGRLYREYTVLLDPPIYATPEKQKQLTSAPASTAASTTGVIKRETEEHQVIYNPEYQGAKGAAPSAGPVAVTRLIDYSGGDYGPAVAGDTLWSVASAMRPDTSISVQQMMFALLRANPEAFINNNINGLKRGHILKLPATQDIQTLDQDQAFAEAKMQNSLWEEDRGSVAATVTPRPEGIPTAETPAAPATEETPVTPVPEVSEEAPPAAPVVPPQGEPELRLVAPAAEGESPAPGAGGADNEALTQELALANESLEALKLENLELKDKLSETDAIVDDLKRLIVLKENDLAALQQRIVEQEAAKAETQQPAAPEATAPKPVEPAPAEPAAETTPAPEEPAEVKTPEEAPVETAPEPEKETEAAPESAEPVDTGPTSLIPPAFSGIIELIRANILYIGGGLAGLVLLVLISRVIKRRKEMGVEIPQSAFPEFNDMQPGEAASEDVTDINPELEESEAPTILPGSEDETITPEFGGGATRVAAAPPAKRTQAAPAPAVEEEDPLAEVNVFLAYEHFDQAEEFVKKAIAREPDNLEFHTKLLEVYYAANNKKGYEKAARVLHDKVDGQGSYWDMAVTMWQEISPSRALFAEPQADEEDTGVAASTPGGGIVNIAGEGAGAAGLDFDLDSTAGGELLNVTSAGSDDADVLDVTAAIDLDNDEAMLDMTAAVDTGVSGAEADEELSLELPADDAALDMSLDFSTPGEAAPAGETLAADDNSLDFSFELEKSTPAAEEASADALDLSFDVGAEADTAEKGDDNALDISLDLSAPGVAADSAETAAVDDNSLDFSFALDMESPAKETAPGAIPDQGGDEVNLLDVTAAVSLDDNIDDSVQAGGAIDEDVMNVSGGTGDDLLDVTRSRQFDLDNKQDLLDVTAAASAGMDADELLDLEKKDQPEVAAENASNILDFELAPDGAAGAEPDFAGIDLTSDQDESAAGLDFNIDTGSGADDNAMSIDMDSTMQIPSKGTMRSGADTGGLELVIDEEDSDDRTIMVPRTKDAAEQSADDEIASQLDLAKAYVELGNTAEAKTILDEVIAIGNAQQRQQAQEILGQI